MSISHRVHREHGELKCLVLLIISVIFVANSSCSIPSLETAECSEARGVVREFYSHQLGNSAITTDFQSSKKFLTPEFAYLLTETPHGSVDKPSGNWWYHEETTPKSFRVGGCDGASLPNLAVVQVLLFWHDDNGSRQATLDIEVERQGTWKINRISSLK